MVNMTNNSAIAPSNDIGETPMFAGNTETDTTLAIEDDVVVIRVPLAARKSSTGKSDLLAGFSGTVKDFGRFGNVRISGSVFVKEAKARKPTAASGGVSAAADPSSRAAAIMTLANGMIQSGTAPAEAYKLAAGMV